MRTIVKASLRFRWIVLFLAASAGSGLRSTPRDEGRRLPRVRSAAGRDPNHCTRQLLEEVEELITVPIEDQLNGIEGLAELRSKSVAQLSSIRLIFERGADELKARQLVQERLSQITPTLPTWASPPFMMPALSATSRILKIGLTSDDQPNRSVRDCLLEDPRACFGCPEWPKSLSGVNVFRNATSRWIRRSSLSTTSPCDRSWTPEQTPSKLASCNIPTARSSAPVASSRKAVNGSTSATCNPLSTRSRSAKYRSSNATAK